MMGVFDTGDFKYSIADTDLENLNRLLVEMDMHPIVPAWGAHDMPAADEKRVSIPVKGGIKKTKRRQTRHTKRRKIRKTKRRIFK
jgi:hypothetical protein